MGRRRVGVASTVDRGHTPGWWASVTSGEDHGGRIINSSTLVSVVIVDDRGGDVRDVRVNDLQVQLSTRSCLSKTLLPPPLVWWETSVSKGSPR